MDSDTATDEPIDRTADPDESPPEPSMAVARFHPTIRPVLVKLFILVVAALLIVTYLDAQPGTLGNREMTNVAILVVALLTVLGIGRYLIQIVILYSTEYGITDETVWRQFELLRKKRRREVPYGRLRSCELEQGRIQSLLGYGTISMNQGLGTLKLANVEQPDRRYGEIQERMVR